MSGACELSERGRESEHSAEALLQRVHSGGAYGDGIDGLLGMSFLSRFNINIDGKTVRISPRTAR